MAHKLQAHTFQTRSWSEWKRGPELCYFQARKNMKNYINVGICTDIFLWGRPAGGRQKFTLWWSRYYHWRGLAFNLDRLKGRRALREIRAHSWTIASGTVLPVLVWRVGLFPNADIAPTPPFQRTRRTMYRISQKSRLSFTDVARRGQLAK